MTTLRNSVYAALLALVAISCGGGPIASNPTPDPLRGSYVAKGGGGAMDAMKALTAGFAARHSDVEWQVDDVGSDAGISLTVNGEIDLGFISRDLRAAEKGTVETTSIGYSATGVGVNAANPVKALTKDQVVKIFTGQITDWKDVGGSPGKIRVLVREPDSSTRSAFESYFFGSAKPTYSKDVIEVFEIDETIRAVSSFKDSIGMLTMDTRAFGISQIRLLAIDGIAATRENVSSGTFPIRRPLFAVHHTDPAKVKPAVKAFLEFIRGPDGQKIISGL